MLRYLYKENGTQIVFHFLYDTNDESLIHKGIQDYYRIFTPLS
jgi:hypothetical protein